MKNANAIITLLIFLIVASIAAGYAAGFFVYREYQQKTACLERQVEDRFGKVEDSLKDFYISLENAMDENKIERKKALAVVEKMKEDMEEWKKGYASAIAELGRTIENLKVERLTRMVENLQDNIDDFRMTMQDLDIKVEEVRGARADSKIDPNSIDLGKISVKK